MYPGCTSSFSPPGIRVPILWKRFNSISRMRPACRLILLASSSLWWRDSILWMLERPPGFKPRPGRIFTRKPRLLAVADFLRRYGCPLCMTCDRDSRWVGSHSLRHFPSACCRFRLGLGIHPNICPPRRPDKNPYGERLHRTFKQECLQIRLPTTLGEVRAVTQEFLQHYNHERPQEANGLQQSPTAYSLPKLAGPAAGARPDQPGSASWRRSTGKPLLGKWARISAWMSMTSMTTSARHLQAKRRVLFVNAPEKVFGVWLEGRVIKSVPRKRALGPGNEVGGLYRIHEAASSLAIYGACADSQHRMRQLSLGV
jgi:hypothetical protein